MRLHLTSRPKKWPSFMHNPPHPLPHRFARPGGLSFISYVVVALLVLWSLEGAGWSLDRLLSSPPKLADFFSAVDPQP
jgi:phosphonate transport system permease protein